VKRRGALLMRGNVVVGDIVAMLGTGRAHGAVVMPSTALTPGTAVTRSAMSGFWLP
jgi:hypothetical protein